MVHINIIDLDKIPASEKTKRGASLSQNNWVQTIVELRTHSWQGQARAKLKRESAGYH